MRSLLVLLFYVDYQCRTQPRFRRTLLLLTLIFLLLLWSPWRPMLCSTLGACSGPPAKSDQQPRPVVPSADASHRR